MNAIFSNRSFTIARLGMLTPSSNTILEPETQALIAPLGARASVHFGRFRVTQIGLDATADSQFALEPILAAADLLADAKPDLIAWNGTSAGWRGFHTDERLCDEIESRTGIPATSSILSFNAAMRALGVRKLGLVTPYTADVQHAIARNYATAGITVVSEAHAARRDNFSFSEITDAEVQQMCRDVAGAKPDAIAIVCTNMRGARLARALEDELDIPILDSVAVTLWGCLQRCGVPTDALRPFGQVFGLAPDWQSASGASV
ncbi:MAG: aspartate/glutamate racemase family protein [Roseovarius sp.]|nr:aspartate/glutamate racemase family protein [Roseovarius sp.]